MNSELYYYLSGISSLHLTPEGAWMGSKIKTRLDKTVMPDAPVERLIAFYPALPVNKSARDFLILCDGKKALNQIKQRLGEQYNVPINTVKECIDPFIQKNLERGYIKAAAKPHPHPVPTTGRLDAYYPVHMQFELTDKCNLFCSYCYREAKFIRDTSFTKRITPDIPYEEVEHMIELCISNGVANMELSGGEPMMSTYFEDIIRLLARHEILVAVETNGTLIDEAIADVLAEAGNVMLSVSLDGTNEEINAKMCGCRGAFGRTINGLKLIADRKIVFRVAATASEENIDCMEDLLLLAQDIGAVQFGFALPNRIGREKVTCRQENEEDPTKTLACRSTRLWKELCEKYPRFVSVFDETTWKYHQEIGNCGVGHRSFGIDPEGNVRICTMNMAEWLQIGNLYRDRYEDIFTNSMVEFFRQLRAPTFDICGECKDLNSHCGNCVIKGIDKYLDRTEQGEECQWATACGVDEFLEKKGVTAAHNDVTTGQCARKRD